MTRQKDEETGAASHIVTEARDDTVRRNDRVKRR